jgi:hypothetical protein
MAVHAGVHAKEPSVEYFGHILGGNKLVVHIDTLTPDDAANAVAAAGRDGNSNAIRTALGRLDSGYVKIGTDGYRIAYARRIVEADGTRYLFVFRNELALGARDVIPSGLSLKEQTVPPLAAGDLWLPKDGPGQATISGSARVVFRSMDDLVVTDWGWGGAASQDMQPRKR